LLYDEISFSVREVGLEFQRVGLKLFDIWIVVDNHTSLLPEQIDNIDGEGFPPIIYTLLNMLFKEDLLGAINSFLPQA